MVLAKRTEEIEHDECYTENDNTNHPESHHADETFSLGDAPVQGTAGCGVSHIGVLLSGRDRIGDGYFGSGGGRRVRCAAVDNGSG